MLEKLTISKMSQKSAGDKKMVERKIHEVGDAIREKLKTAPYLSTGDIVMSQMKENFSSMDKKDQYRVRTVMPMKAQLNF